MINPFKIKNNSRFAIDNRTIVIEILTWFNIYWYFLDEWWKYQPIKPKLNKSNILKFIFESKKYKYA